jgi:hypothetical protein
LFWNFAWDGVKQETTNKEDILKISFVFYSNPFKYFVTKLNNLLKSQNPLAQNIIGLLPKLI